MNGPMNCVDCGCYMIMHAKKGGGTGPCITSGCGCKAYRIKGYPQPDVDADARYDAWKRAGSPLGSQTSRPSASARVSNGAANAAREERGFADREEREGRAESARHARGRAARHDGHAARWRPTPRHADGRPKGPGQRSEFAQVAGPLAAAGLRAVAGDAGAVLGLAGRLALDGGYKAATGRKRRGGKRKANDTLAATMLAAVVIGVFAAAAAFGWPLALVGAGGTYLGGSAIRRRVNRRTRPKGNGPVKVRTHERKLPGGRRVTVAYHGRKKATP